MKLICVATFAHDFKYLSNILTFCIVLMYTNISVYSIDCLSIAYCLPYRLPINMGPGPDKLTSCREVLQIFVNTCIVYMTICLYQRTYIYNIYIYICVYIHLPVYENAPVGRHPVNIPSPWNAKWIRKNTVGKIHKPTIGCRGISALLRELLQTTNHVFH